MNQQIKNLWVEALRSEDYQQARGSLLEAEDLEDCEEVSYCCLGVLCELYRKEVGGFWRSEDCGDYSFVAKDDEGVWDGSTIDLPSSVMEWAELPGSDPTVEVAVGTLQYRAASLSKLNDEGLDFESIANLIENQL